MPEFITEEDLLDVYFGFRERYRTRDERFDTMEDILKKNWNLTDSAGEDLDPASPNLIHTALEDTAEASSSMPTLRVRPFDVTATSKNEAEKMERIGIGYLDVSRIELEIPRYVMDLGAFGLCPLVVLPDLERQTPIIVKRDPRLTYPEPTYHPGDSPKRVLFIQERFLTELPPDYQEILKDTVIDTRRSQEQSRVVMIEYVTDYEYTVAALLHLGSRNYNKPQANWRPVILDQIQNPVGVCPVVPMSRITWDGEFRGQFDDVIDPMLAYARLLSMRIDYADQSVYSDIWARDVVGDIPFGGGSFIELGPNGAIGRVPPAVTSLDLYRDLERLEDNIHVGGRWPKSRPGQVDQAIASGKFVEATVGMMSTVIKTHHQVMARGLAQAVRLCYLVDQFYFGGVTKNVNGVMNNQSFVISYDPATDINLEHKVTVEYGLGLGRDPQTSAVLMMQYAAEELISDEFVQENIEGLTDVARERKRIDLKKLEQMMFAKILQGVEQGTVPDSVLPEMHEAREKGESLVEIFKEYVATAEAEQDLLSLLGFPGGGVPGVGAGGGVTGEVPALPAPPAPPPQELLPAPRGR